MNKCARCSLHKTATCIKIDGRGVDNPKILFVGEAPDKTEDMRGKSFIGKASRKHYEHIDAAHIDKTMCRWEQVIKCVPWENARTKRRVRPPTNAEMTICGTYLEQAILTANPEYIVPMGKSAIGYFLPQIKSVQAARGIIHEVEIPSIRYKYSKYLNWRKSKTGVDVEEKEYGIPIGRMKKVVLKAEKEGFPEISSKVFKVWCTYNSASVLYSEDQEIENKIIEDLAYLKSLIDDSSTVPWDDYELLDNLDDIKNKYDELIRLFKVGEIEYVAIDVETTALNPWLAAYRELLLFSICYGEGKAFIIPINHPESPFCNDWMSLKGIINLTNKFLDIVPVVGHNIKFDFQWLYNFGIKIKKIAGDTYLSSWTLFNDNISHDLETLVTRYVGMISHKEKMNSAKKRLPTHIPLEDYCEKKLIEEGRDESFVPPDCIRSKKDGKLYRGPTLGDLPIKLIHEYCCADTDGTFRLQQEFDKQLHAEDLYDPHYSVSIPAIIPIAMMEIWGIRVDMDKIAQIKEELTKSIDGIYAWFEDHGYIEQIRMCREDTIEDENKKKKIKDITFGYSVNKAILLYDILGIKFRKDWETNAKGRSTSKDVLSEIRSSLVEEIDDCVDDVERPCIEHRKLAVEKLLEYSADSKTLGTWVNNIPPNCDQHAVGHANFGIRTTDTFRLNCKGHPGWHGIKRGSVVKNCVVPLDPDGLIGIFDYSQMELRILGNYCGDENMIRAFRGGKDIHTFVSAMCLGKPEHEVTKEERNNLKEVSLGVAIGGRGTKAVADALGIPKRKAQKIIDTYLDTFPSVRKYFKRQYKNVLRDLCIYSEWGFRRAFPAGKFDDDDLRRRSINNPIQSTAGDITTVGVSKMIVALIDGGMKSTVWATVHDSVCNSIAKGELYQVIELAQSIMVDWMHDNLEWLKVPLKVDFEVGVSWGETVTVSLVPEHRGRLNIAGSVVNFALFKRRVMQWGDQAPKILSASLDKDTKKITAIMEFPYVN